jgi:hypothetical protein
MKQIFDSIQERRLIEDLQFNAAILGRAVIANLAEFLLKEAFAGNLAR